MSECPSLGRAPNVSSTTWDGFQKASEARNWGDAEVAQKTPVTSRSGGGTRFIREASPNYERDSCNIEFHKGWGKPVDFNIGCQVLRCMM